MMVGRESVVEVDVDEGMVMERVVWEVVRWAVWRGGRENLLQVVADGSDGVLILMWCGTGWDWMAKRGSRVGGVVTTGTCECSLIEMLFGPEVLVVI